MIEKNIAAIEESALLALKDNEVSEGRTIEYKQSLPGNTRDEKIRFIAADSGLERLKLMRSLKFDRF